MSLLNVVKEDLVQQINNYKNEKENYNCIVLARNDSLPPCLACMLAAAAYREAITCICLPWLA